MNESWYLLSLKYPRRWKEVSEKLEKEFGRENVWIPSQEVEKYIRGKKHKTVEPLFSGYAFLRVSDFIKMSQQIKEDLQNDVKLVNIGNGVVSDVEVRETMQFVNNLEPKIMSASFIVGERARIKSGPFQNFEGMILELQSNNCKIELSVFGRALPVSVSLGDLEKV